ncbi:MAG TPA: hypothetical protein DCK87_00220 [Desulfotomaculum sp.]|nr:hypothetical protein [Desulfotomaculum sp.]
MPAEKTLNRRSYHSHRNNIGYAAKGKDCRACDLRLQCTKDSYSRSVQRHIRKDELDKMISITKSFKAKRDLKIRQYLMERSYARSVRYGFDRARWRGLWKVSIQEYVICTIQNIETLIRYLKKPLKGIMAKPVKTRTGNSVAAVNKAISCRFQAFLYTTEEIYRLFVNYKYFCKASRWFLEKQL